MALPSVSGGPSGGHDAVLDPQYIQSRIATLRVEGRRRRLRIQLPMTLVGSVITALALWSQAVPTGWTTLGLHGIVAGPWLMLLALMPTDTLAIVTYATLGAAVAAYIVSFLTPAVVSGAVLFRDGQVTMAIVFLRIVADCLSCLNAFLLALRLAHLSVSGAFLNAPSDRVLSGVWRALGWTLVIWAPVYALRAVDEVMLQGMPGNSVAVVALCTLVVESLAFGLLALWRPMRSRAHAWLAGQGEGVQAAAGIAELLDGKRAEEIIATARSSFRAVSLERLERHHLEPLPARSAKVQSKPLSLRMARVALSMRVAPSRPQMSPTKLARRFRAAATKAGTQVSQRISRLSRPSRASEVHQPGSGAHMSHLDLDNTAAGAEVGTPPRSSSAAPDVSFPIPNDLEQAQSSNVQPWREFAHRGSATHGQEPRDRWSNNILLPIATSAASGSAPRAAQEDAVVSPYRPRRSFVTAALAHAEEEHLERRRRELFAMSEPARLGDVDAFVSHSWHDDVEAKWNALQQWRSEFKAAHNREPLIWLDCCSIDQSSIKDQLPLLPVYLAGCKTILALWGPSYFQRLWCVVELYCFFQMGAAYNRITFRCLEPKQAAPASTGSTAMPSYPLPSVEHPLQTSNGEVSTQPRAIGDPPDAADPPAAASDPEASETNSANLTRALLEAARHFDARDAQASDPRDRSRLLGVIEGSGGGVGVFNRWISTLVEQTALDDRSFGSFGPQILGRRRISAFARERGVAPLGSDDELEKQPQGIFSRRFIAGAAVQPRPRQLDVEGIPRPRAGTIALSSPRHEAPKLEAPTHAHDSHHASDAAGSASADGN